MLPALGPDSAKESLILSRRCWADRAYSASQRMGATLSHRLHLGQEIQE